MIRVAVALNQRIQQVLLRRKSEEGFTTAELLMNAALGVALLAAVYVGLKAIGLDIVSWITDQIGVART